MVGKVIKVRKGMHEGEIGEIRVEQVNLRGLIKGRMVGKVIRVRFGMHKGEIGEVRLGQVNVTS